MRSLSMIGLDVPKPGKVVFQAMFLVASQLLGKFSAVPTAELPGPRNWVQSAAGNRLVEKYEAMTDTAMICSDRLDIKRFLLKTLGNWSLGFGCQRSIVT